ncbi:hypothetical protein [Massilibacterium senegalense]|uniref:hypothetical protein n=1 Tax=Massilibacterium senegalense TaxID=1632858 RepID=UPI000784946C|nr:hypothetical protein [Massilibacterium senegalense]
MLKQGIILAGIVSILLAGFTIYLSWKEQPEQDTPTSTTKEKPLYTDVSTQDPDYPMIVWATEKGIVQSDESGHLNREEKVSEATFLKSIAIYYGLLKKEQSVGEEAVYETLAPYHLPLVEGKTKGTEPVTNGKAATLFLYLNGELYTKEEAAVKKLIDTQIFAQDTKSMDLLTKETLIRSLYTWNKQGKRKINEIVTEKAMESTEKKQKEPPTPTEEKVDEVLPTEKQDNVPPKVPTPPTEPTKPTTIEEQKWDSSFIKEPNSPQSPSQTEKE